MKKLIICLSVLIFVTLAQAQFKFEVTQEMKKKQAEITITGKTFDEVWKATTRTLMSLKFQIKESDKEGGTILALKRKGLFYESGDVLSSWSIMRNSSPSGKTLTLVFQRLRRQRSGWLG